MARLAGILVSLVCAVLLAGPSLAQKGPMAPGAEVLPETLRPAAETPLVLTPAATPTQCLDMSDKDDQAQTVQMWTCTARWNQKVWVEPIAGGNGDQFRIRIGELACLLDSGRPGARATMGICNDAPAAEPWTASGGLLIGASGLCLDAQNAADGAPVVAAACNASTGSQQWRLEAMRTALNRLPTDKWDPSGLGEYFYTGYVPERVEEFRPRFTQRALTSEERAEIKSLTAPWRKVKALDQLIQSYKGVKGAPVSIPWSTLRRLSELGESGDKDAMRAAREAFAFIRDTNYWDTFPGWDETAFPHADDSRLAYGVAEALANIWGAHYWQKHGPDRLAAAAFTPCDYGLYGECLGYRLKRTYPKTSGDIYEWIKTGNSKFAFNATEITFRPAAGTYEERQKKFISIMDGSAFTNLSDFQMFDVEEKAAQAVFAEQTGQLALWDNVRLNSVFAYPNFTSQQEAYMRTVLQARADAADWRTRFEAFMASGSDSGIWSIQQGLLTASEDDMLRFAEKHVVMDEALSARLCGSGREWTPACQRSRLGIAARRAEYDAYIAEARVKYAAEEAARFAEQEAQAQSQAQAQAERDRRSAANARKPDFWDQLAGLAEGFAAAAEAGNQQVTVRTYDSAGNYVGSETMTRSRAAGLGAQPSN
jgi:hypothetical protein